MNTNETKINSILMPRYLELREELKNATLNGNFEGVMSALAANNEIVKIYAAVNDTDHRDAEVKLFDYVFVHGISGVTFKPCPFCGMMPALHTTGDVVSVSCVNCTSVFIVRSTREAAAKAWNTRYTDNKTESIEPGGNENAAGGRKSCGKRNLKKSRAAAADTGKARWTMMTSNNTRGLWRGKCVDNNNEWVEGDLSRINSVDNYFIEGIRSKWPWRVDPSTLGECTGFLDKNYNIAFEGDIIKFTYGSETVIGVVKYDKYIAAFILNDGVHSYLFGGDVFSGDCEIIGNIHDNPELLKGDTDGQD